MRDFTIPPWISKHNDAPLTDIVFREELAHALGVTEHYIKHICVPRPERHYANLKLPPPRYTMPSGIRCWYRADIELWAAEVKRRSRTTAGRELRLYPHQRWAAVDNDAAGLGNHVED